MTVRKGGGGKGKTIRAEKRTGEKLGEKKRERKSQKEGRESAAVGVAAVQAKGGDGSHRVVSLPVRLVGCKEKKNGRGGSRRPDLRGSQKRRRRAESGGGQSLDFIKSGGRFEFSFALNARSDRKKRKRK